MGALSCFRPPPSPQVGRRGQCTELIRTLGGTEYDSDHLGWGHRVDSDPPPSPSVVRYGEWCTELIRTPGGTEYDSDHSGRGGASELLPLPLILSAPPPLPLFLRTAGWSISLVGGEWRMWRAGGVSGGSGGGGGGEQGDGDRVTT